jgi:hypothetical protein
MSDLLLLLKLCTDIQETLKLGNVGILELFDQLTWSSSWAKV